MTNVGLPILIKYLLVPVTGLYLISEFVFGSDYIVAKLNPYRPLYEAPFSSGEAHLEKQLHNIDHTLRSTQGPLLAFIGSSTTVNGLDVDVLNRELRLKSNELLAVNFGLTKLSAYELPFLEKYFLHPKVKTIVYQYDARAFANDIKIEKPSFRWNYIKFIMYLLSERMYLPSIQRELTYGLMAQSFHLIRFRNMYKTMLFQLANGLLEKISHPWIYDPSQDRQGYFVPNPPEAPFRSSHPFRKSFLDSMDMPSSTGYRNLRVFIDRAKKSNKKIILMGIPDLKVSVNSKWKRGFRINAVDQNVLKIANENSIEFISRDHFIEIEQNMKYFRDDLHLNKFGRDKYSKMLADKILMRLAE